MQAFKDAVPTMIGGAADLVESTKTEFVGGGLFSDSWVGRNIPFGIREHAMGSIVNGIAVHGGCVKPYGSTFLIFSDYMRPAVRLSALMGLPVVWAWTHDSVGLGEDGPTHQPVETYAALRAIPNLWFVRPADANETAVGVEGRARADRRAGRAVALAAEGADARPLRPCARIGPRARRVHAVGVGRLARPDPDRDRRRGRAHARGGTQARRRRDRGARRLDAVLGALRGAAGRLPRRGAAAGGEGAAVRRAGRVELGWEQWVGDRGGSISIEHFGASAPGATVLEQFGYNLDNVVARASCAPGACLVKEAEAVKTFLSLVSPGFCIDGRAAGRARSKGSRCGTTGTRSRWCRRTAARCRSGSPSTRARSRGLKFYEGGGGVRPPRRSPA